LFEFQIALHKQNSNHLVLYSCHSEKSKFLGTVLITLNECPGAIGRAFCWAGCAAKGSFDWQENVNGVIETSRNTSTVTRMPVPRYKD
jgi:hypothetical protein